MSDTHEPINPLTFPYGIRCGCRCGCSRTLNDGNAMTLDVSDDPEEKKEWEADEPGCARILLSVCVECYIGNHPPKAR